MWEQTGDCPPIVMTETQQDYHLDESSFGYAQEREREEHDRHIKGDAVGVMRQVGIPTEAAKALADQMKTDADALRKKAEALSQDKEAPWELTHKRLRAIGDADGRLVERVVGE